MVTRSVTDFHVLWTTSVMVVFPLLDGYVRGTVVAAKPVVFSYSSGGNSNHPAIISHHYRPMTSTHTSDSVTRPPGHQVVEQYSTVQTLTETTSSSGLPMETHRSRAVDYNSEQPIQQYDSPIPASGHSTFNRVYSEAPSDDILYQNQQTAPVQDISSVTPIHHDVGQMGYGSPQEEMPAHRIDSVSYSLPSISKGNYKRPNYDKLVKPIQYPQFARANSVQTGSTSQDRGGLTYTPIPSYDEVDNEPNIDPDSNYMSTTPIPQFESVRNKLPSIEEYPPPNPGYITAPLHQKHIKSIGNDKVLQQPKFFAYSNDIPDADSIVEGEVGEGDDNGLFAIGNKKLIEKHVKGGGLEHHSNNEALDGDKSEKGYTSKHKHDEGDKGHHDKEAYKGKYKDEKGTKGKKKEKATDYGAAHQAEKGRKSAKYGDSGEHKKGHSIKGEHNVHTKDEYLKKHIFYDEHHEGGDHEKSGGFKASHGHRRGGKKKKGHRKSGYRHQHKGKKGYREKSSKLEHQKSHKDANGANDHYKHHKKHWSNGGLKKGGKWGSSTSIRPEK